MKEFSRPIVLVSRCLEFDKVRYNGQVVRSRIVQDMMPFVDFIKVCPEVGIGLGVPRSSLRFVRANGEDRLVMPDTGEDLTDRMNSFTQEFLDELEVVDGFIFKGRSPSMGLDDARVYAKASMAPVIKKRAGLFVSQVIDRYPGFPIEENDRLRNKHIRHHFLTHLYTFAAFRKVRSKVSIEDLQEFHNNNRFLFMSYSDPIYREMSLLPVSGREIDHVLGEYDLLLRKLMHKPGSIDLKLESARSMFSTFAGITPEESSFFENMLDRYESNRISWDAVMEILRLLAYRSIGNYSYDDGFLYPYPEGLKAITDEDREKEYWDK
ncbi:YbgA family protein [Methanolobus bombayensis]|uniref:YbgA family protein n=1 Tax=Methanolobus bombayensis TaxID=38023 RepID=UPI001AE85645|nr:DUF523 and DUF1722 domain-containing protein [Methanolobus bombayensis]MBP1909978.1 uncharacterized protein YbbK (DUF523 family)/uncharacterized protein YbgA (DUF1722 family) [Methanolobus bombayensis]